MSYLVRKLLNDIFLVSITHNGMTKTHTNMKYKFVKRLGKKGDQGNGQKLEILF